MKTYNVEITDLFCGQMNYSYCTRFTINAKSLLGAIQKISRKTGLNFRRQLGYGEGDWTGLYHSTTKLTGVYVEEKE